jgi:hypothetical protein
LVFDSDEPAGYDSPRKGASRFSNVVPSWTMHGGDWWKAALSKQPDEGIFGGLRVLCPMA